MVLIISMSVCSQSAFAQQQPPNGSFENWSGDPLNPDDWYTLNIITSDYPTFGTTRTTDAYDGTYALKLVSGRVDATPMGFPMIDTTAMAGIGIITAQGPQNGIPYTDRPNKLTFYYKYTPGTYPSGVVDTAQVVVTFRPQDSNTTIGRGTIKFYGNAVTQYTFAEIPITWWSESTPNSLEIDITSSVTGFSTCDICHYANQIGSELIIDKLAFEFSSNIENNIKDSDIKIIYPNPATDIITLNINNINNDELTINIYNVIGSLVKSEILKQNKSQIYIGDLNNGSYIVEVKSKEYTEKQKLIIQR